MKHFGFLLKTFCSRLAIGHGARNHFLTLPSPLAIFNFTKLEIRCFASSCNKFQEDRHSSRNAAENWAQAVIKEVSQRESQKNQQKINLFKRPSSASLDQGVTTSATETPYSSVPEPSVFVKRKRRRRLSDNMWTSAPLDEKLIWVDCEMTGLNYEKDHLLEIGILITDGELNEIARHEEIIFHMNESVFEGMDEWCKKHHGESGLIEASRKSTVTHAAADEILLKFVQQHTNPGECPLAGNSVGMDRVFIGRQLPKLSSHLHYRNVDVSTLKELVRRWYPTVYDAAPRKKYSHRVHDDIMESISELKYYRSTVFAKQADAAFKAEKLAGEKKSN